MARRIKRKVLSRAIRTKEKTVALSCRPQPKTKEILETIAHRNGRTVSAEATEWLELALSGRSQTHFIMMLVADAIDGLELMHGQKRNGASGESPPPWSKVKGATWLNNPDLHHQARGAVNAAFELLKPKGYPPSPTDGWNVGDAGHGKAAFEVIWDHMRRLKPGEKLKPHQRRLSALRAGLGKLPDKAVLWGQTGIEAQRSALSDTEREEFIELSRKRHLAREENEADPSYRRMTPIEAHRYVDLSAKAGICTQAEADLLHQELNKKFGTSGRATQ